MKSEIFKEALKNNLDSLDSVFKWFLSVAVVIWWAGLSRTNDTIKTLGLEIDRREGFGIAGAIFIVVNLVIFLKFKKLHSLLQEMPAKLSDDMLTFLMLNEWILNPFAVYNGKGKIIPSILQKCLLVIIWWLCNMSLFSLFHAFNASPLNLQVAFIAVFGLYAVLGLLSLNELVGISKTLAAFSDHLENEALRSNLLTLRQELTLGLTIGILVGFGITWWVISNVIS